MADQWTRRPHPRNVAVIAYPAPLGYHPPNNFRTRQMIDPSTKSASISDMQEHYPMLDALHGGTAKMRKAKELYLPKNPEESQTHYDRRLKCAVLLPFYARTIEALIGKPFKKAVTLGEDVPESIEEYCENIDQEGSNLTVFTREVAKEALDKGISYILVDYPRVQTDNGEALTRADEQTMGLRPYAVHIKPGSVIAIGTTKANGATRLTEFRYAESMTVMGSDFIENVIYRIRVFRPTEFQVWEKSEKGEWVMIDQGVNTLGYIPIVPMYSNRTGFYLGKPGLLEIAFLNVAHWQSRSEQQNILHVARVPILTIIGGDTDPDKDIVIGTSSVTNLPVDADMKYVEHSGRAIDAGDRDLKNIQEEARQSGSDMNVVKPGRYTATQAGIEDNNNLSPLQAFAGCIEDAIDNVLQIFADWMGLPEGGHCEVYKDFAGMAEGSIEWLRLLYEAGAISGQTLFAEAQRLGYVGEDIDFEEQAELMDTEGPEMVGDNPQQQGILRVVGR